MFRNALGKAMAVGRFASAVFGLALVLGLVFGVATMALGANGGNFILGQSNTATALTRLTGNVNGASMQVINNNGGTNDTALNLQVQDGEAPMRINSDTKVTNLTADNVDGQGFDCPVGTLYQEGACIEGAIRGKVAFSTAQRDCLDAGKRLPTVAELQTFRNRPGVDFAAKELTSALDSTGGGLTAVVVFRDGISQRFPDNATLDYRCAVPAG